jgi:hypothetical protein
MADMDQIKTAICKGTHKMLKDFGYPDLTIDLVEQTYDRAISGEAKRTDIVDMFVYGEIEKAQDQLNIQLIPE